jgi:hypothetical protein
VAGRVLKKTDIRLASSFILFFASDTHAEAAIGEYRTDLGM